jgi:hypothetical protein
MGAENERLWREHCERCDRPKDGGPAFPVGLSADQHAYIAGMSLRDYFAAAAMQGWCACPTTAGSEQEAAELAYKYADAMIAARERKEGSNG